MDMHLTPFKRRYVDNWRKEVNKHLRAGTMWKTLTDTSLSNVALDNQIKNKFEVSSNGTISHEIATQTSSGTDNSTKQTKRVCFKYSRLDNNVDQSKGTEKMHEGMQSNCARKINQKPSYQRNEKNPCEDIEEEHTPLVIIDPQLMTPMRNYEINPQEKSSNNRPKSIERNINNPFKFTSVQNSRDIYPEKKKEVWSIRCQVQSRDRNSFVVSRSNLFKYNDITNHSFLNLPSRFQNDKYNQQQITSKPEVSLNQPSPRRNITSMFAVQAW
ncbi:unnamed protein product [Mytilus coruscus]|uniref:Uncharacterized protein n=1 Tax=Mytilus coruscus TaxID=42192 RepID=A0A6J8AES8_MYTCO|nr:unnamed protein product [Mytilus coruscus]